MLVLDNLCMIICQKIKLVQEFGRGMNFVDHFSILHLICVEIQTGGI